MLELFCEIAVCVFAVFGAYTLARSVKRYLFRLLERKAKGKDE